MCSNWLDTRNLYTEKSGHICVFLFDSKSDIISHVPQNIIIPDFSGNTDHVKFFLYELG